MRRLDQWLANLGYCSRRDARTWAKAGRVHRDGQPVTDPGAKLDPTRQAITVDGEPLDHPAGLLLLLHKPTGLVCSHDPREGGLVYDLLPPRWQRRNPVVTSVGRLDKDTSGLLLLTDQTALVHRLTSPKHKVPKVYRATVDRDFDPVLVDTFAAGTLLLEGERQPCAPATLEIAAPRTARLTLTEGKYHQVRRMFSSQGWHVETLHRETFGPLNLGALTPGTWRELPLDTFA